MLLREKKEICPPLRKPRPLQWRSGWAVPCLCGQSCQHQGPRMLIKWDTMSLLNLSNEIPLLNLHLKGSQQVLVGRRQELLLQDDPFVFNGQDVWNWEMGFWPKWEMVTTNLCGCLKEQKYSRETTFYSWHTLNVLGWLRMTSNGLKVVLKESTDNQEGKRSPDRGKQQGVFTAGRIDLDNVQWTWQEANDPGWFSPSALFTFVVFSSSSYLFVCLFVCIDLDMTGRKRSRWMYPICSGSSISPITFGPRIEFWIMQRYVYNCRVMCILLLEADFRWGSDQGTWLWCPPLIHFL